MRKFKYIKSIKSRLWKKCIICDTHFKNEKLWQIKIPMAFLWFFNHKYYICQSCLSDEDTVKNWRKEIIKMKIK